MNTAPTRPALRGSLDALPLFIPALPFAFVFGVVVAEAGIPEWLGWSSSPVIFGGAIQVTLFTLIGEGASVAAAVSAALLWARVTCSTPSRSHPGSKTNPVVPLGGRLCAD